MDPCSGPRAGTGRGSFWWLRRIGFENIDATFHMRVELGLGKARCRQGSSRRAPLTLTITLTLTLTLTSRCGNGEPSLASLAV